MKTNNPLRYALWGASALILASMVFTRCTSEATVVDQPQPQEPPPVAATIVIPPSKDAGLVLFENTRTRAGVRSFFAQVTGSVDIADAILTHAAEHEIPTSLAFSLAWVESRYVRRALNRNPSSMDRGLFQLNSKTFPFLEEEQFFDPFINARYGLSHLRFCLDEGGNEIVGLAMYNAGTQGVRKGTPFTTLHFVAAVVSHRDDLERRFRAEFIGECSHTLALNVRDS